ncbi:MAG: metallophosphoesterase family protein [Mycoplasma sp.]
MNTKILIISDTHGDDTWLKKLNLHNYDYLIHAGDHSMSKDDISRITPYYVDGNNDWGKQETLFFNIRDFKFMLTHGHNNLSFPYSNPTWYESLYNQAVSNNADFVIFGHTHIPIVQKVDKVFFINPGSMSFSRHNGKKCYCELVIDNDSNFEIFEYVI